MVSRGRLFDVVDDPGFYAEANGQWLGYATYHAQGPALEITSLEALKHGSGIGGALLAACVDAARDLRVSRLWLITTNDNTEALRFYQRRGFVIVAVHRDAVTRARAELKPEIPLTGSDGIPIRDEIELELPRGEWDDFVTRYGSI